MIKNIRWPVYWVVFTLTLFPILGSYYAIRGITDSASTIGLSPAVILEMNNASSRLKELAKLDPKNEENYRSEFNHLQETKQNYQSLIDLSPALSRSYLEVFFIIFGLALAVAMVMSSWLNRKIIRSHDQALSGMKTAEERNAYLENREAWRLVAQKFVHEVKNPLTPIKVMVGHLLPKYQALSERRDLEFEQLLIETREMVSEETSKIMMWVEAFAKYAQIPDAKLESANLGDIINEFTKRYSGYWPNVIFVSDEFKSPVNAVSCDAILFKQVIFNLVKNASEAVGSKSVQIQFTFETDSEKSLTLLFKDDGPGLPTTLLPTLFRPSASSKKDAGGMGLGLAISKKIMLEQSGDIQIRPSASGCVFELKLPYWNS